MPHAEAQNGADALRLGDRIRIVRLPPSWEGADFYVPSETRELYQALIDRRRALVIREVDERGHAWIRCKTREGDGRIQHHSLVIDDGCWVRVGSRAKRSG